MNVLYKVWAFLDPASEGNAYQPMPKERKRRKKKDDTSIFSFRLRNRLAYRRF